MAAAQRANKVLVVGADNVGKKYIVSRSQLLQTITGVAGEPTTVKTSIQGVESVKWLCDTKYYQALLELHVADVTLHGNAELHKDCQAMILAFDAFQEGTFTAITRWAAMIESVKPSVLMLVANERQPPAAPITDDKLAQQLALRERARDWAIDHGVEFVELTHETAEFKARAQPRNVDKTGTARVVESLQSNMWPHLRMKPREQQPATQLPKREDIRGMLSDLKSQRLAAGGGGGSDEKQGPSAAVAALAAALGRPAAPQQQQQPPAAAAAAAVAAAAGGAASAPPADSASTKDAPAPSAAAHGGGGGSSVRDDNRDVGAAQALAALLAGADGEAERAALAAGGEGGGGEGDAGGERGMAAFERLFEQIAGVRERGKQLPDAQRRVLAAEAMASFMSQLGLEDDGDGEGEDADGEDEDAALLAALASDHEARRQQPQQPPAPANANGAGAPAAK